jgi:hypothetical protein
MASDTAVLDVFGGCVKAIHGGELIHRESERDKEFHFQNWVRAHLTESRWGRKPVER